MKFALGYQAALRLASGQKATPGTSEGDFRGYASRKLMIDITNPRHQALKEIERIESLPRPKIWRETKDFLFKMRPDLGQIERGFTLACKEMREKDAVNKTAASKSGSMRNTMKIPQYVYEALLGMDRQLSSDLGSKNGESAANVGKQLYNAFPEYRIARTY